jgi:hypothetical protein
MEKLVVGSEFVSFYYVFAEDDPICPGIFTLKSDVSAKNNIAIVTLPLFVTNPPKCVYLLSKIVDLFPLFISPSSITIDITVYLNVC